MYLYLYLLSLEPLQTAGTADTHARATDQKRPPLSRPVSVVPGMLLGSRLSDAILR